MQASIPNDAPDHPCRPDLVERVIQHLRTAADPTTGSVARTVGISRDEAWAILTALQEQGTVERHKIRRDGKFIAKPWHVVSCDAP